MANGIDWIKWYPRRIQSDMAYRRMTPTDKALYRDLLDVQALEGYVPDDECEILALISNYKPGDITRFFERWAAEVLPVVESGKRANKVMAEIRAEAVARIGRTDEVSRVRREVALKGWEDRKRADSNTIPDAIAKANGSTNATVRASYSSSVSSDPPDEEKKRSIAPYPAEFEQFWSVYPKRKAKGDALKAWGQIADVRPETDTIIAKVKALALTDGWREKGGKYIPHPAKWLRAHGWLDDSGTVDGPLTLDDCSAEERAELYRLVKLERPDLSHLSAVENEMRGLMTRLLRRDGKPQAVSHA